MAGVGIVATPSLPVTLTTSSEVVGQSFATTAADGTFTLQLYKTSDLSPANTYYNVNLGGRALVVVGPVTGAGAIESMIPSLPPGAPVPLVSTANIADGAVTSAKILDGTIVDADVATGAAIAASKLNLAGATFPESAVTNLTSDLALKAPLASPALTGTPTVPAATWPLASLVQGAANTVLSSVGGVLSYASALVLNKLSSLTASFKGEPWFDVTHPDFGAKGDLTTLADGAITTGTPNLTSATAAFTVADQGKSIEVVGAGAAAAVLRTTILTYVGATAVTLAANAGTTVSAAVVAYGTDDTAAVQAAHDAAAAIGGGVVNFPPRIGGTSSFLRASMPPRPSTLSWRASTSAAATSPSEARGRAA